ncbi:MAG: lysophospholipid acyltransferase family protein [Desulfarculaceae bacterium]|jgi:1-acyl-sn-glycerol-3-phosphate acyltransferase
MWLPLRLIWSLWALVWFGLVTGMGSLLTLGVSLAGTSEAKVQWVPRIWARALIWGVGCPVSSQGLEKLASGQTFVFASNHTSALDIPAVQAVLPPNFRWIAKKELFSIPVFGQALRHAGYIPIDRSNRREAMKSLKRAAERIAGGASVVIFPEGTRSPDGKLLPFKSGGLGLAIKSGRPVVPMAILGAGKALPPKKYILSPQRVRIVAGSPISTSGLELKDRDHLANQVREKVEELLAEN